MYTFFGFLVRLGANSNLVILLFGFFAMHFNRSLSAAEGRRVHPRADNDGAAEAPAPSSCTTPRDSDVVTRSPSGHCMA